MVHCIEFIEIKLRSVVNDEEGISEAAFSANDGWFSYETLVLITDYWDIRLIEGGYNHIAKCILIAQRTLPWACNPDIVHWHPCWGQVL